MNGKAEFIIAPGAGSGGIPIVTGDISSLQIPDLPDASTLEQVFISFDHLIADIDYIAAARSSAGVSEAYRRLWLTTADVPELERWLSERGFVRQDDVPGFMHIWARQRGKL